MISHSNVKLTNFDIENILDSMVVLVDTREQNTEAFRKRMGLLKAPYRREKLDFGDYSCEFTSLDGSVVSLKSFVRVERKMSIDELALCFTRERNRFEREFIRAKTSGAILYLLVENSSFEKIIGHKYRSQLNPKSLMASIFAWQARYPVKVIFCKAETTSELIYNILHYELKVFLERQSDESCF